MVKPIALDSNLALLLAVGAENRNYIARHKRLAAYEPADFDQLRAILNGSAGIIFCPNVVTETSNLIRYANEPIRSETARRFRLIVQRMSETYVPSAEAMNQNIYVKRGATDAVLMKLAETGAILLTVDLDLYLAAGRAGHSAVNFNHLREARLEHQ